MFTPGFKDAYESILFSSQLLMLSKKKKKIVSLSEKSEIIHVLKMLSKLTVGEIKGITSSFTRQDQTTYINMGQKCLQIY